jgi:hypothetical protein
MKKPNTNYLPDPIHLTLQWAEELITAYPTEEAMELAVQSGKLDEFVDMSLSLLETSMAQILTAEDFLALKASLNNLASS